jgi:hypothetical protein
MVCIDILFKVIQMRCAYDQDWTVSKDLEGNDRAAFLMYTAALT